MFYIESATVIFLGLVLGSFATALIYRVPQKIPWGAGRSACPTCKTTLNVFDLIPVLSWCFSMGRCRHCAEKISWRYPLTELVSGLLCFFIYLTFGLNILSLFLLASVPILIALCVIDLKHMILPNQLVFILMGIGLVRLLYLISFDTQIELSKTLWIYLSGAAIYAFISWFLGFVLTKILKRNSLGFGDVKFFMVAGLWLGIYVLPYFMILSGVLAIVFALAWRVVMKQDVFPFGPALIVSFYCLLLFSGSFSL
ncbi:MAG: prepilin peptidase [Zetaproteobacteria bacterium]|nr:MAG: prepilin peptidase [Zetaproteobacteria bacterium]